MKRIHYYMLVFRDEEQVEVFRRFQKLAEKEGRTFKGLLLKLMKIYLKKQEVKNDGK